MITPFPNNKYNTIMADPPWPYNQKLGRPEKRDSTRGGLTYQSMSIQEISELSVQTIANKDCIIGLWTTNSHIHEALHILNTWGFTYKTMTTWVKTHIGLGYWLRGQTEHMLIGIKGHPRWAYTGPHGAAGHGWSTFLRYSSKDEHSVKPVSGYQLLEGISIQPRIELFSRSYRIGWDSWGDQMPIKKKGLGFL